MGIKSHFLSLCHFSVAFKCLKLIIYIIVYSLCLMKFLWVLHKKLFHNKIFESSRHVRINAIYSNTPFTDIFFTMVGKNSEYLFLLTELYFLLAIIMNVEWKKNYLIQ